MNNIIEFTEEKLDEMLSLSLKERKRDIAEVLTTPNGYNLRITRTAYKQVSKGEKEYLFDAIIKIANDIAQFIKLPLVLKEPWHSFEIRRFNVENYLIFIVVNKYRINVDIIAIFKEPML